MTGATGIGITGATGATGGVGPTGASGSQGSDGAGVRGIVPAYLTVYSLDQVAVSNNAQIVFNNTLTTSGTSNSPTLNVDGSVTINYSGNYFIGFSVGSVATGGGDSIWALTVAGVDVASYKTSPQPHLSCIVVFCSSGDSITVTNRSTATETLRASTAVGLGNSATLTISSLPS
jgi:hypothetical protein